MLAEQGDEIAQYKLGLELLKAETEDVAEALRWLNKSAAQGYDKAQFEIAMLYATVDFAPKDESKAARWLKKAADLVNSNAQNNVGNM